MVFESREREREEHLDCQLRIKERLEHPPTPDLSDDDEGRKRAKSGGGERVSYYTRPGKSVAASGLSL